MPWKQTSLEAEQVRFIQRWQAGGVSFVDLCRQFGISRKTGYKRVDRFRWNGWEGLRDLTPIPASSSECDAPRGRRASDRG